MSQGKSGRFVLEANPAFKRRLYTALRDDGLTLKTWFLQRAEEYLRERKPKNRRSANVDVPLGS